jgi:hypothetical protein
VVEGDRAFGRAAFLRAERIRGSGGSDVEDAPVLRVLDRDGLLSLKDGFAFVDELPVAPERAFEELRDVGERRERLEAAGRNAAAAPANCFRNASLPLMYAAVPMRTI